MDPTGPFARRFPLVARTRPTCLPLIRRVAELSERAHTAERTGNLTESCAVHNQAALIASDCGLPDLAWKWCRRQATLHLRARPLDAPLARLALEPLTNLARLHIREGQGERAFELMDTLFTAVSTRTTTWVEGVQIPADLTDSPHAHREVRSWLWAVLLATGARALAIAGRWTDAHTRLHGYNGIGRRMLDGRQVAVIAHAVTGDTHGALTLLTDTTPGDPWENAVTACLTIQCHNHTAVPDLAELLGHYHRLNATAPGVGIFHTRLGLSYIDALTATGDASHAWRSAAGLITAGLIDQALQTRDGYAARDVLGHNACRELLTAAQQRDLTARVEKCGLHRRDIPATELTQLTTAFARAEGTIARSHTTRRGSVTARA